MGNYEIRVNVEIVETNDPVNNEPVKTKDGSFKLNISESEAISIDKCEKKLLWTNYETIRDALSKHLTEASKKKAEDQGIEGELIINDHGYQVDGEVGRFTFRTHNVKRDGRITYNTAKSVFPELTGEEWYKTSGFKEIGMIYGTTENSYRKAADLINRIRYQEGATPSRSLLENTETEGAKIIDFIEQKTTEILEKNHFTEEGMPKDKSEESEESMKEVALLSEEEVKRAIEACRLSDEERKEVEINPVCYEDPEQTVNISMDDVGVKKQKEERGTESKGKKETGKREYVHNTIAHIQKGEKSYTVNGYSTVSVLKVIIGFLLNNNLLGYRLQFFVDGQRTLQASILKVFSWFGNIGIILDWYHLEDKCKKQLSLAMKGRQIRNDVLNELMRILWYGMVDKAIKYLSDLDESLIKDKDALVVLIGYIERNRPYIPCFAVRKELGLRNSSNIGEKMNDLVVSDRQKHNGMSWSKAGSVALASLTVVKRNKEHKKWFEEGDLEFKFAA